MKWYVEMNWNKIKEFVFCLKFYLLLVILFNDLFLFEDCFVLCFFVIGNRKCFWKIRNFYFLLFNFEECLMNYCEINVVVCSN